ncbi:MAG: NUDIX hydrolase [Planctomycetaceae bacterium]|nr:NUDIX hydrolase [Planctomycetaceae bacterium]
MRRVNPQIIGEGKHLRLVSERGWEYADRVRGTGVVAIVATTADDELILTEQSRVPVKRKVVDLAAGLAGDVSGEESEAFEQAARRELEEETGFHADEFWHIFTGPTSAGMVTEMVAFFRAVNCQRVSAGGGDHTEDIRVHVVPLAKIGAWLTRKQTRRTCIDPKVYAALGILGLEAAHSES